MKIVAVIPARGGSKRIPRKNIRNFCGKSLIAWTILGALKSKYLDRVIVSTDDKEIARIAKRYGAEVPFLRPAELAIPTIGIEPTLKHVYEWLLKNENYKADALVLLMPTSPLRQTHHIDEAIEIFKKKKVYPIRGRELSSATDSTTQQRAFASNGVDSVVAVNETPANHTPYWTLVRNKNGKVTLWGRKSLKNIITRSQDFPQKCYARNDLVYVLKPKNLFEKKSNIYGNKVELYIIPDPSNYEADINTSDEWQDAEMKFQKLRRKGILKI